MIDGVTERKYVGRMIGFDVRGMRNVGRKIRRQGLCSIPSTAKIPCSNVWKIRQSTLPRKPSKIMIKATVPETDTGG